MVSLTTVTPHKGFRGFFFFGGGGFRGFGLKVPFRLPLRDLQGLGFI